MPPDANSRTILRICGASLILLATWLHGNGKGFERGQSRCMTQPSSAERMRQDSRSAPITAASLPIRTSPAIALR